MKIDKLDPKETPKVIAIGVLGVGLFGYVLMTMLAETPPPPPPKKEDDKKGQIAENQNPIPNIVLPPIYRPDPFQKPAGLVLTPPLDQTAQSAPPGPRPGGNQQTLNRIRNRIAMDEPGSWNTTFPLPRPGFPPAPALDPQNAGIPVATPQEPQPIRPTVWVTGVITISGEETALVDVGEERKILRVGDVVGNDYKVRQIARNGVFFVNGKDTFFVNIGGKPAVSKTDPSPEQKPEPKG